MSNETKTMSYTTSEGQCGEYVSAGALHYPCRLDRGHPADEPHFAPESTGSVTRHTRWEAAQQEAAVDPPTTEEVELTQALEALPIEPTVPWVEPTKQRPGDQVLPTGDRDQESVQDRLMRTFEESKRIGVERYGDLLRPFNGRDVLGDVADEARDMLVYLTQMQMEADSDRDRLVKSVSAALEPYIRYDSKEPTGASTVDTLAGVAVDRVMGYVVGSKMSNEIEGVNPHLSIMAAILRTLGGRLERETHTEYRIELPQEVLLSMSSEGVIDSGMHRKDGSMVVRYTEERS